MSAITCEFHTFHSLPSYTRLRCIRVCCCYRLLWLGKHDFCPLSFALSSRLKHGPLNIDRDIGNPCRKSPSPLRYPRTPAASRKYVYSGPVQCLARAPVWTLWTLEIFYFCDFWPLIFPLLSPSLTLMRSYSSVSEIRGHHPF